jgi:hypothetical protein
LPANQQDETPPISLDDIMKAAGLIEQMGQNEASHGACPLNVFFANDRPIDLCVADSARARSR